LVYWFQILFRLKRLLSLNLDISNPSININSLFSNTNNLHSNTSNHLGNSQNSPSWRWAELEDPVSEHWTNCFNKH